MVPGKRMNRKALSEWGLPLLVCARGIFYPLVLVTKPQGIKVSLTLRLLFQIYMNSYMVENFGKLEVNCAYCLCEDY